MNSSARNPSPTESRMYRSPRNIGNPSFATRFASDWGAGLEPNPRNLQHNPKHKTLKPKPYFQNPET